MSPGGTGGTPEGRGPHRSEVTHPGGTSSASASTRTTSPRVPGGLLARSDAPPDEDAWDRSIAAFRADLKATMDLVADPETDLFAPIPHGQGRTILREALSVADHGANHPGQLATVRRLLGAWHDESA